MTTVTGEELSPEEEMEIMESYIDHVCKMEKKAQRLTQKAHLKWYVGGNLIETILYNKPIGFCYARKAALLQASKMAGRLVVEKC